MGFFDNLIGGISGKSAEDAAEAHAAGVTEGINTLNEPKGIFREQSDVGNTALNQLATFTGGNGLPNQIAAFDNFQHDPGFQAELDEGLKAALANASAAGGLQSGGTLKALQDRGTLFKRGAFNDRFNRLAQLAGFGQTASGGLANIANAQAGLQGRRGQIAGEGIIGASNAATGFTNQLLQLAGTALGGLGGIPGIGGLPGGGGGGS